MQSQSVRPVSGHLLLVKRERGDVFFAKGRDPLGVQFKRKIGPAWKGKGRPPAGYYTRQTAERELRRILTDVERGTLARTVRTGATVADAIAEWLRHAEHERGVKPSTIHEYRSAVRALERALGDVPLEKVTMRDVERWRESLLASGRSRRTVNKLLTNAHGVFERARRAWDLPANPVADVERVRERYSGAFDFYSPEEVMALVRAAEGEQDGAIFLTAAFAGLRRGELVALRWRDVDFANETIRVRASVTHGELGTPKSGKVRSVPMVPDVAEALARLARRERFVGDDDLVFPGLAGEHLDGSALRRRYVAARDRAGLRPLRFHDLRHTFGSLVINRASLRDVQEWMGHASPTTTARYLHHKSRGDEARRIANAFKAAEPLEPEVAR